MISKGLEITSPEDKRIHNGILKIIISEALVCPV